MRAALGVAACALLAACTASIGGLAAAPDAAVGTDAGSDAGVAAVNDGGNEDAGSEDAGAPAQPFVYVGSGSGRIFVFAFDEDAGVLVPKGAQDAGTNPSFLAFHPTQPLLYAVDEKSPGAVLAFRIHPPTGQLTFLNQASSGGNGPAHVFADRSGKVVLAANYGSGTVAVLPLDAEGSLGAPSDTRAPGANAHQILADGTNRWAFVPCLGDDRVAQFELDPAQGTLTANPIPAMATAANAGPRHLAFHPSNAFAYLINEKDSTLTACAFDAQTGQLTPKQTVSTLPSGFTGANTCAEVVVHPNGRFVYGSNRGHDSIAVFAIDATDGTLTLVQHQPTQGASPRSFALNAAGTFLIAANQSSGTLTGFRVDPQTGELTAVGQLAAVPSPAFVGFH